MAHFSLAKMLGTGANDARQPRSEPRAQPDFLGRLASHERPRLAISQPLLAGFGERIVKEPLTQAERDLVYQCARSSASGAPSRSTSRAAYYRLLQLEDSVHNQENNVANLETLSEQNTALAEAGRLSAIELGPGAAERAALDERLC
jgi:hypothetical protein